MMLAGEKAGQQMLMLMGTHGSSGADAQWKINGYGILQRPGLEG